MSDRLTDEQLAIEARFGDSSRQAMAAELIEMRAAELELSKAREEIDQLREFIAASKECSTAATVVAVHEDNERYRTAFEQTLDRMKSGDYRIKSVSCSWCQEEWPHLDGESTDAAKQHAREHAFSCVSHPLRIERDRFRALVDKMRPVYEAAVKWRDINGGMSPAEHHRIYVALCNAVDSAEPTNE